MKLFRNASLREYSYIKVGGKVNKLYLVENEEEFIKVLDFESRTRIIGQASKILFAFDYDSSPYILDRNDYIDELDDRIIIGSGTPLAKIGTYFEKKGYKGFSSIRTIPGRLGGSIVQNASCYNESISDYLLRVKVYYNHKIMYKNVNDLMFSYRSSIFKFVPYVILSCEFKKQKEDIKELKESTKIAYETRSKNQPIDKLTLGSTFKNHGKISVSKTLDELNFKGYSLTQGVSVSKKHANFIEIEKDCSYEQIMLLIHSLGGVLYKRTGIYFPLEIIIFREDYFGNKSKI